MIKDLITTPENSRKSKLYENMLFTPGMQKALCLIFKSLKYSRHCATSPGAGSLKSTFIIREFNACTFVTQKRDGS